MGEWRQGVGNDSSLRVVSMYKSSQGRKIMESSVKLKVFSRAVLKVQIQDSGAYVGENFIHASDQLRMVCGMRRELNLREIQSRDGQKNKNQDL